MLQVGARRVLVLGLLTHDVSIYAPSNTPTVTKPATAAAAVWEEAKGALGCTPDALLPMTHMLVPEDKALCCELAKHAEIGPRMPLVLGGHEHDMYVDEMGKARRRTSARAQPHVHTSVDRG